MPYGLPKLNKENLIDYLTHLAFSVTAWHELVGTIVQYLLPPEYVDDKIKKNEVKEDDPNSKKIEKWKPLGICMHPGKEELDVQSFVQGLCLAGLTGLKNPLIMQDWTHLLPPHPDAKKLHGELMNDLQKIVDNVEKLNNERPHKCQVFNPKFLETSITV